MIAAMRISSSTTVKMGQVIYSEPSIVSMAITILVGDLFCLLVLAAWPCNVTCEFSSTVNVRVIEKSPAFSHRASETRCHTASPLIQTWEDHAGWANVPLIRGSSVRTIPWFINECRSSTAYYRELRRSTYDLMSKIGTYNAKTVLPSIPTIKDWVIL